MRFNGGSAASSGELFIPMLRKADSFPELRDGSALHLPPASMEALDRLQRGGGGDVFGEERAEVTAYLETMPGDPAMGGHASDAVVASAMETLLNRVHRSERRREVDEAFTVLLALKASGAFVYEHCVRLIHLALDLTGELGLEGTPQEQQAELGLIYRDTGEAAWFLSQQTPREQASLIAYLSGVDIAQQACLHDVGKIQVPQEVLYKPAALTDEEMGIMRRHPVWGAAILAAVPSLAHAIPVTRHHHERWDGYGYPDGLVGEGIPVAARVVSVVDAYDAMVSDRPYRAAMSEDEALREIARQAGSQFDPTVAQSFLRARQR